MSLVPQDTLDQLEIWLVINNYNNNNNKLIIFRVKQALMELQEHLVPLEQL